MKRDTPERTLDTTSPFRFLLYVPVPWVFVLAYLVGAGLNMLFSVSIQSPDAARTWFAGGIVLFVIGGVLAGWSLAIFHKAKTTTTPGEKSAELVMKGPYRFSRNPMYVSLTLCYLGEAGLLVQVTPLIMLVLTLAYIHWVVIPIEEKRLKEVFAETYEAYCTKVRRWL